MDYEDFRDFQDQDLPDYAPSPSAGQAGPNAKFLADMPDSINSISICVDEGTGRAA